MHIVNSIYCYTLFIGVFVLLGLICQTNDKRGGRLAKFFQQPSCSCVLRKGPNFEDSLGDRKSIPLGKIDS